MLPLRCLDLAGTARAPAALFCVYRMPYMAKIEPVSKFGPNSG